MTLLTPESARRRLDGSGRAIQAIATALPPSATGWSPSPEKWTTLEVVCHLADEEREDFRTRVRLTLEDPALPWPPIDPPGWVTEREYASRDLHDALADFAAERATSLAWIDELELSGPSPEAWDLPHQHAQIGPMTARDVLAAWVAHDLLHLRQLARLQHEYLRATSGGPLEYAGEW